MELTDKEIEATAARLADITQRIAELTEEAERLKARLRESLKTGTDRTYGSFRVRVLRSTSFSPDRARLLLPPSVLTTVVRTEGTINEKRVREVLGEEQMAFVTDRKEVIDEKAVRELVSPELFRACRVGRGRPYVRVERRPCDG